MVLIGFFFYDKASYREKVLQQSRKYLKKSYLPKVDDDDNERWCKVKNGTAMNSKKNCDNDWIE